MAAPCMGPSTSRGVPSRGRALSTGAQGRLLVTMLAAIAEFERELIRERTGAGRERAMAEGVKFGRKRKLSDYQCRSHQASVSRRDAGSDR
jgi:DNA invertase Pin-like site-specific DNA recombinase